jgi:hypothetical protein
MSIIDIRISRADLSQGRPGLLGRARYQGSIYLRGIGWELAQPESGFDPK